MQNPPSKRRRIDTPAASTNEVADSVKGGSTFDIIQTLSAKQHKLPNNFPRRSHAIISRIEHDSIPAKYPTITPLTSLSEQLTSAQINLNKLEKGSKNAVNSAQLFKTQLADYQNQYQKLLEERQSLEKNAAQYDIAKNKTIANDVKNFQEQGRKRTADEMLQGVKAQPVGYVSQWDKLGKSENMLEIKIGFLLRETHTALKAEEMGVAYTPPRSLTQ